MIAFSGFTFWCINRKTYLGDVDDTRYPQVKAVGCGSIFSRSHDRRHSPGRSVTWTLVWPKIILHPRFRSPSNFYDDPDLRHSVPLMHYSSTSRLRSWTNREDPLKLLPFAPDAPFNLTTVSKTWLPL
jgi:hypothetical protein